MRPLLLAIALVLTTTAPAAATQVSYVDGGEVWVSTLDGTRKRSISGSAPQLTAGEGRAWTEQAQSDDGWIVGVARIPDRTGAAAPTRLWSPDGAIAAESTLGYHAPYNNGSLAMPVQLDLTPRGQQLLYTYSDLVYAYPVSTLYEGTWIANASNSSGEPFAIPNLVGSSLAGSRWVGINRYASGSDANVVVEAADGQWPFTTAFTPWFHATGAREVDVAANGSAVAVTYRLGHDSPIALGLFAAAGVGAPLTGASCDMPTVGDVYAVSISQDGSTVAWTDDRGLLVAPMPPLGSSPCQLAAAPVVISPTGAYPALGPTTLATSPPAPGAPPAAPGTPPPTPPTAKTPTASSRSTVTVARTVKAWAFARGLKLTVAVKLKGVVTAVAKVGRTTIARGSATAKRPGRVALTVKAPRQLARRLSRYRGKMLTLTVKAPGGTTTVRRKLR